LNDDDAVLICLPVSFGNPGGFDDNEQGPCSRCGQLVCWRPHAPPFPRVCMDCFHAEVRATGGDGLNIAYTEDTRRDLLAYALQALAAAEAAERKRGH